MIRHFDRVIAVDWSAADGPGPARPAPDRCWLAWGDHARGDHAARPAPEYFRTRAACARRVVELCEAAAGRVLVGFDFPFGFPQGAGLPGGRALCALLGGLLVERSDHTTNRFEVAAELNRRVAAASGERSGPFWGHPAGRRYADLSPTQPPTAIPPLREVDARLRGRGIQSPFKLAYAASVGSQAITGLAAVDRMMAELGPRARLWPFETGWGVPEASGAVVFAEIWPALADFSGPAYAALKVKDARQVAAVRDWALTDAARLANALARPADLTDADDAAARTTEGWIVGAAEAVRTAGSPAGPSLRGAARSRG